MWLLDETNTPVLTELGQAVFAENVMPVTDPTAIKFANNYARTAADKLGRAYYLCDAARDRWDSLGGGQPAIDVMLADVRAAADAVVGTYQHCFLAEKLWFLGTNVVIPNTSETLVDGSPADGRPIGTGAKIHAVMARAVEFQNWLFSATQSFSDAARDNAAGFNTVIEVSSDGSPTLTVAAAGNFMNRAGELRTNYEASGNANLGNLLALGVRAIVG